MNVTDNHNADQVISLVLKVVCKAEPLAVQQLNLSMRQHVG